MQNGDFKVRLNLKLVPQQRYCKKAERDNWSLMLSLILKYRTVSRIQNGGKRQFKFKVNLKYLTGSHIVKMAESSNSSLMLSYIIFNTSAPVAMFKIAVSLEQI